MTSATFRPDKRPYELVVFDIRAPGAVERLLSEDAAVELLDADHAAMIVRAGGAGRLAERRVA